MHWVTLKYFVWVLVSGVVWFAGCNVGPNYKRPVTAADSVGAFSWLPQQWADANDPNLSNAWWRQFNDPVTDELVQKALLHNTDLAAAAAAVDQSCAFLTQAYGARLPEVSLGFNRTRQNVSFNLPSGRESFIAQSYTMDLSISYMVDVFGKLRRAERAAEYELFASENDRQSLAHAVVAQVIATRIDIATQQRLLEINEQTISNWEKVLEIIDRRYQQGLSPAVDVYIAKENLASAKAQKALVEQSLILLLHALDVLCGQAPETTGDLSQTLPKLPELLPVPAGLPADLLDRRPDVRSAEMRLAAGTERIGVRIAEMYPDLTLTATGGYASDHFRNLTFSENQVYAAILNAMAPVFKGGRLKAGVEAAEAAARQSAAQYAGAVLNAMREVEDALVKQQKLTERITQLTDRFEQAQHAERLATDRYTQGVDKILLVLETERRRRQAENELALSQGDLWKARVELFLAIGGDWGVEETQPVAAAKQTEKISIGDDKK
ncbi:MAG: efflux transporter outer membrane subunit [Planctomycetes bacterium]|nr:efflux transporter outer membrane subunit [Planctomycetota bacterium]